MYNTSDKLHINSISPNCSRLARNIHRLRHPSPRLISPSPPLRQCHLGPHRNHLPDGLEPSGRLSESRDGP